MSAVLKVILFGFIVALFAVIAEVYGAQKVVAIRVEGNKRTKSNVIVRELKTQIGDSLNPEQLDEDRERVLNLQLFERVEIGLAPGTDGDTLVVRVWERWYIFPYPVLFINEHDFSKVSYGAGLVHLNFGGRAQIVHIVGWAGYNPGVEFGYFNPWFGGAKRLFCDLDVSSQSIRSKSLHLPSHDERRRRVSLRVGKRFGYAVYVSSVAAYTGYRSKPPTTGAVQNPDGLDRFGTIGGSVVLDWRDFRPYPWQGLYFRFSYLHHGLASRWVTYDRVRADVRLYGRLPVGSLGIRAAGAFSRGKVPAYDRVYIGYEERVRGHFHAKREGDNALGGSVEWKVTLIPVRYWELQGRNPFLQAWKFGVNAAVFFDAAKAWGGAVNASSTNWLRGFGVGLHFRVPYAEVLRVELAFDEGGRAEWIFDVGASF